jgi:hypothetical protein
VNNAGWFASLVCIPQCQDIIAAFDDVLTVPAPDDSNYIDICIGDVITFAALGSGSGVFPQNNILYSQTAATSLFIWDFGDGTTDTGQIVTHTYTLVRGYDVALTIIDVQGCTNNNYLGGRVRVSQSPFAQVNPCPICVQATTHLTLPSVTTHHRWWWSSQSHPISPPARNSTAPCSFPTDQIVRFSATTLL